MNLKKHLVLAVTALTLAGTAVHAQTKMGVVDLSKVFKEYYRTKQSDEQLKSRAADYEKVGKGMLEDYKRDNDKFKTLVEAANDQAVSQEERDKRRKEVEKAGAALQEAQTSLQTYDRNARSNLAEQQKRLRDSVLRDIRGVVEERAKAAGYNIVIDTAAETANQTPVVLYTTLIGGPDDLTDAVSKQLNANAPADGGASAPKPEEKKDAK